MNVAVILAGGVGTRVGSQVPKQYIEVLGKPIIAYTLEKFQNHPQIDAIEIVCAPDMMDKVRGIVMDYGITKVQWYAPGGETFQDSTVNGLFHLKEKLCPEDIVLLHFAVGPMVTDEIIEDAIRVCELHGNAIASTEMDLCTCIKDDAYSTTQSILRETLMGFSAPWAFKFGEVCEVYETAIQQNILAELEPHTTSVYFALGKTLYFSKSVRTNIKITYKEDLDIFEGYLLLMQKRAAEREEQA